MSEALRFVTDVQACIDAHAMLDPGAKIIVAVSGGADSMALLSVLYRLRSVYDATLVVAHVNHQLRGDESTRDAVFVEQHAAQLGLAFYLEHIDVKTLQRTSGLSPQHAARQLRYQYFSTLQRTVNATHIALGHTADDQAETLLGCFLRGSGPAGLAGIPPVRFPYIRPLMMVRRQDILAYLKTAGVPWVEDGSNAHLTYLRNRVRLELLPLLRQYNPQIDTRLNELAEMCRAENSLLEQQTDDLAQNAVHWQPGKRLMIHCRPYSVAPLALQRRLLRRLIDVSFTPAARVSFRHIEGLRRLIVHGRVGQRFTLPAWWMAERHRDTTLLWNTQLLPPTTRSLTLPIPGYVDIPELAIRLSADVVEFSPSAAAAEGASIDLERVRQPLTVRFRQPGDRFYPLGAPGRKKLKDFLIDKKVPKAERDFVPLVLSGANIVWVVGYSIADPYKVRPDTRHMARLRCETREPREL